MLTRMLTIIGAVSIHAAAAIAAPLTRDAVIDAAADITVVAHSDHWTLVPSEQRNALDELRDAEVDARTIESLARSLDPMHRGLAILLADQRGDVETMLRLSFLLEDDALTIPRAAPTAGVGEYAALPQTVGEYLSATYHHWFGVDVDGSPRRFARTLAPVAEPDHLVRPWIVRLLRARGDAKQTDQLREQIAELPDDVQAAVIALGHRMSLFTTEDARQRLAPLAAAVNRLPATTDPMLTQGEGELAALVHREATALIAGD
jgi:hypothetical protein